MQTFLPYDDFTASIKCLDDKRLGKQRVEAMQILKAKFVPNYGWTNHPCTKMWWDYPEALGLYMNICIDEWIARGFNNTMNHAELPAEINFPHWLGDERIHISHQSNLLRKDPVFYGKNGWNVSDSIPYFWGNYSKQDINWKAV